MVDIASKIELLQGRVERDILKSTCRLEKRPDTLVVTDGVIDNSQISFRNYKGSIDIPCNFQSSRAYRHADYDKDVATVLEYFLHVPIGVDIKTTDTVITPEGRRFNIVKLLDEVTFEPTKSAIIIGTDRFNASTSTN